MNHQIHLESVLEWFAAKAGSLEGSGVTIVGPTSMCGYDPSVRAWFNANSAIGQITFLTIGEVDFGEAHFEVLAIEHQFAFFREETVAALPSQQLEDAYAAFIAAMTGDYLGADGFRPVAYSNL